MRKTLLTPAALVAALFVSPANAEARYSFQHGFPANAEAIQTARDATVLRRAIEAYKYFYPKPWERCIAASAFDRSEPKVQNAA